MGKASRSRTGKILVSLFLVTIAVALVMYLHNNKNKSGIAEVEAHKPGVNPALPPTPVSDIKVMQTPTAPQGAQAAVAPTTNPAHGIPTFDPAPTTSPVIPPAGNTPLREGALRDGKAAIDAGNLVEGRQLLNDALLSGKLPEEDQTTAKQLISQANQTLVYSPRTTENDPWASRYTVQPGDLLTRIAYRNDIPWELLARINGISDPKKIRSGQKIKILKGPLHAVVSKKHFMLDLYFGSPAGGNSMYITTLPVGLGAEGSTPDGVWIVQPDTKIKNPTYYSPRGEGVIEAGDPKNPIGHFWIGLEGVDGHAVGKESYGIHGTIDPDSIGKQMSMGCIRLRDDDIKLVFESLIEKKSMVVVKE